MKKLIIVIFLIIPLLRTTSAHAQSDRQDAGFIVMYNPEVNVNDIRTKEIFRQDSGVRIVEYFEHLGIWHIVFDSSRKSEDAVLTLLKNDPTVINANPVRNRVTIRSAIPDDTDFDSQWALHNTGQTGGTAGADIKALNVWDITKGNS